MDRPSHAEPLSTFLVERYSPGIDLATLRGELPRLEAAAREMSASGTPVTHMISILMPIDEVVFSLIQAGDEQLVRELGERSGLPADRIAEAITLRPGSVPEPAGGPTP
jgi:hypothetical protein